MTPAPFISFEGGEGAGKSTQINILANALKACGLDVLTTRQPGGTAKGAQLRKLLVEGSADWSPMAETLLMLADRQMHLEEMIRPALAAGQWILCDRYMDSTTAYQGAAGGLGVDIIAQLQAPIIGTTVPDLTFLLDLPIEEGLARADARGKEADARGEEADARGEGSDTDKEAKEARFENKGAQYHERVRAGFLALAKANPKRIVVINAAQDIDAISQLILTETKTRFASLLANFLDGEPS